MSGIEEFPRIPNYDQNPAPTMKSKQTKGVTLLSRAEIERLKVESIFGGKTQYGAFKRKFGIKITKVLFDKYDRKIREFMSRYPKGAVNYRTDFLHSNPSPIAPGRTLHRILPKNSRAFRVLQMCLKPGTLTNIILDHHGHELAGRYKLQENTHTVIDVINRLATNKQAQKNIAQILEEGSEQNESNKLPEGINLLAYLVYDENKANLGEALELLRLSKKAGWKIQHARSLAHEIGVEQVLQLLKAAIRTNQ